MKTSSILLTALFLCSSLHAQTGMPPDETKAEKAPRTAGSRPLPPLPEGAFTIVILPDTQKYRGMGCKFSPDSTDPVTNKHLQVQTEWITANKEAQNIVFVTHVGDIVDRNRPEEWAVAKQHLDTLRGVVPFGLTVGNHDMAGNGDAHLFQQYFPAASFTAYPWYLGCYTHDRETQNVSANNVNSAHLFSAGGIDFIHLNLECNAPNDVLAWADGVLSQHRQRQALVTTHMDLGVLERPKEDAGYIQDPKGVMRWVKVHGVRGNSAEMIWDRFYRKQPNLRMIFCGDQSRVTALRVTRQADDGHPIHSLLTDYQSEPVLRLMRFMPAEGKVRALTYEVVKGILVEATSYVEEADQHEFTLDFSVPPATSLPAASN